MAHILNFSYNSWRTLPTPLILSWLVRANACDLEFPTYFGTCSAARSFRPHGRIPSGFSRFWGKHNNAVKRLSRIVKSLPTILLLRVFLGSVCAKFFAHSPVVGRWWRSHTHKDRSRACCGGGGGQRNTPASGNA